MMNFKLFCVICDGPGYLPFKWSKGDSGYHSDNIKFHIAETVVVLSAGFQGGRRDEGIFDLWSTSSFSAIFVDIKSGQGW